MILLYRSTLPLDRLGVGPGRTASDLFAHVGFVSANGRALAEGDQTADGKESRKCTGFLL